ncbi:MAG: hypothetical protein ACI4RR_06270, partial [Eubacterium sp.]
MNINNLSLRAVYTANGKSYTAGSLKTEHFEISLRCEGDCLYARVIPACEVSFECFEIKLEHKFTSQERAFVNGYQSWTDSFEYSKGESMRELLPITEYCMTKPPIKNIGLP